MKAFIIAALIAVASAARLEHLERSYLPPTGGSHGNFGANSGSNTFPTSHGTFGHGGQGSQYTASGSNGFGSSGSNGFGSSGHASNGFGASARGSNGFGANSAYSQNGIGGSDRGSNGFGSGHRSNGFGASGRIGGANAAITNQYLPPNHGSSGSNGASTFGSSIRPACSTCGSSTFGATPQRYTSQQTFGSQGHNIPSTQYGTPQLGSTFGSQQNEPFGAASRQYLTPKASSFQNIPQQAFDEQTGYHY